MADLVSFLSNPFLWMWCGLAIATAAILALVLRGVFRARSRKLIVSLGSAISFGMIVIIIFRGTMAGSDFETALRQLFGFSNVVFWIGWVMIFLFALAGAILMVNWLKVPLSNEPDTEETFE